MRPLLLRNYGPAQRAVLKDGRVVVTAVETPALSLRSDSGTDLMQWRSPSRS